MAWYTKTTPTWYKHFKGAIWNAIKYFWNDTVCTWDAISDENWNTKNETSWYTKNP